MYLRVREIFALAADYSSNEAETHRAFQIIQNKLHFADADRYIACSKSACFCCLLYLSQHRIQCGRIEKPSLGNNGANFLSIADVFEWIHSQQH